MLTDHLTIKEAARFLEVWPNAVYTALQKGTLPEVRDPETDERLVPLPALRARYELRMGGQYGMSAASAPLQRTGRPPGRPVGRPSKRLVGRGQ